MNWPEMNAAVNDAKSVLEKADMFTNQMAIMIKGKLRSAKVNPSTLAALKKELQDYNVRECRWKE